MFSIITTTKKLLGKQHTRAYNRIISRGKITITTYNASETCKIHRPTPILLLRTNKTDKIPCLWQQKFSELGYSSVQAYIELPEDQEPLQTCYRELKQATAELSFFPPLMISFGQVAWRISQKYVSNKPVSGLMMIDNNDQDKSNSEILQKYPVSEFEPHFPLLMISRSDAPAFLDGWIDHIIPDDTGKFEQVTDWMDQVGM